MITQKYLKEHPNHIFVFGDNTLREGKGGAAILRDEPNTYGFITKKYPNNRDESFYILEEYYDIYEEEISKLIDFIDQNLDKTFLISKLGSGLANKYRIFEEIIEPSIKIDLNKYHNVEFLW